MTLAETLGLDKTTTGYGAVIDGILNIRTVTDTQNHAAYNALYIHGYIPDGMCDKPECDCIVVMMQKVLPNIKIVPVTVRVD
jgi:hypothetical protein